MHKARRSPTSPSPFDTSTPVLLLGGMENSLAITRNLARHGITVRVSGLPNSCWALRSRYCHQSFAVPENVSSNDYWKELLLPASGNSPLHGHVIFACNDEAVEFLADLRDALAPHYILDDFDPELQHAMLDKQKTLELAQSIGVASPRFWKLSSIKDIEKIRNEVAFPAIVKPVHSHKFLQLLNCKLFIIEQDFNELKEKATLALARGLEIIVVEMLPGPDTQLQSYSTYIDHNGKPLFHFTKRVIRRYPIGFGGGCYHISEWFPDVAELGKKFFAGIGFHGMATIEFKRSPDLKIIEVNARFSAPHELAIRCGMPMDLIVYRHLTGQPLSEQTEFEQFRGLLAPMQDFLAFLQLRKKGEMT
ncbi:MAG: carboxylate--amine ligase, partial [Rhizobiales bacterium]|nr:carboxylate--amine ligase [Hyphomicrobiales bacterium]